MITKYEVDDILWFIENNIAHRAEVIEIYTNQENKLCYLLQDEEGFCYSHYEADLFVSAEDLIAHIFLAYEPENIIIDITV